MDLSEHTSLAGLAEAIKVVQAAASEVGCEVYVVGAQALDLWLGFGFALDTGRMTEDIDFGIACADWQTFEEVALELEARSLKRDRKRQHRFCHPSGLEIDLIPFGAIEGPDRTIAWPPSGNPVLNLVGFAEAAASTVRFSLTGNTQVAVASLPALAVLKLLAWEDRREDLRAGHKDAQDFITIASHYLKIRRPQLAIEDKATLIERHEFDDKAASFELLGSDMAEFASLAIQRAVNQILERERKRQGPLQLARIISSYDPLAGSVVVSALHDGFLQRSAAG